MSVPQSLLCNSMIGLWTILLLVVTVLAKPHLYTEVSIHGNSGLRIHVPGLFEGRAVSVSVKLRDGSILIHFLAKRPGAGWTYLDKEAKVKPGDFLTFKTRAIIGGELCESEWRTVPLHYPVAPARSMRSYVVFSDEFNTCDLSKWNVIVTANQGGNGEFQVYTNEHRNIYCHDGHLYLAPTFTADKFGNDFLYHGRMDVGKIWGHCTYSDNWGCDRSAANDILPPIMSGRIRTHAALKYGEVEIRAKIPQGDWIWPALWLLPRDNHYGGWPRSGEIDIMESRGNLKVQQGTTNHGINEVSSHLHFGPAWNNNPGPGLAHGERYSGSWHGWHTYKLVWTADHITTYVDNHVIMNVPTPHEGWWQRAHLHGGNIWSNGGKNAPFDQPFQVIMNVAVGGGFFPDNADYNTPKPWHGGSSHPMRDFWEKRSVWQPTWHGEEACMAIDYIHMTQY